MHVLDPGSSAKISVQIFSITPTFVRKGLLKESKT
jgi:hypothetical protein